MTNVLNEINVFLARHESDMKKKGLTGKVYIDAEEANIVFHNDAGYVDSVEFFLRDISEGKVSLPDLHVYLDGFMNELVND